MERSTARIAFAQPRRKDTSPPRNRQRTRRSHGACALLLALLTACVLACAPAADSGAGIDPAQEVLDATPLFEQARAAATSTRSVHHRFLFGSLDPAKALVEGETWMLARTSAADSLIRVEGTERLSGAPRPFEYSTDGTTVWAIAPAAGKAQRSENGPHARGMAATAVYGYLPELVEAVPYWKELGSAVRQRVVPAREATRTEVGGVRCHVVEVHYAAHDGVEPRHVWYFGIDDLLPRGLEWWDATTGPDGMSLWILDLETAPLAAADFTLDLAPRVAAGELTVTDLPVPATDILSWTATTSQGDGIAAEDLRGRVAVLDFWNTWCVICRAQQPSMKRVVADYAERPVTFLGANVFETGDAAAYWQELGHAYPFLVDADPLADLYGVPWQPAVVVLGPQGETLLNLVGGSGDREEKIRTAIDEGLALFR